MNRKKTSKDTEAVNVEDKSLSPMKMNLLLKALKKLWSDINHKFLRHVCIEEQDPPTHIALKTIHFPDQY